MTLSEDYQMKAFPGARIGAVAAAIVAALLPFAVQAHDHREVGGYELTVGFLNEPAFEGEPNGVSLRIAHAGGSHDQAAGADEMAHGALINQVIKAGEHFEFTAGHSLEDKVLPLHFHPDDLEATLTVTHDAPEAAEIMVDITDAGFSPSDIRVRADTVVRFENTTGVAVTLMSGDLPAADAAEPVTGLASSLQAEVTHIATGASKTMSLREAFGEPGHYVANFIPTAPGAYRFKFTGNINGTTLDETFESGPDTFDEIAPAREIQFPTLTGSLREVEGAARSAQESVANAEDAADSARSLAVAGVVIGAAGLAAGAAALALSVRRRAGGAG
jgi:hypothetical protein